MKINFKFIILTAVILFLILFSFILIFNISNNRNIEKKIIIGLDINVPPMGFKSENGEIIGFDIDLANEVFKNNYEKVIFQPIDWDSKEFELNSKKSMLSGTVFRKLLIGKNRCF